jgi:hypothetical protein
MALLSFFPKPENSFSEFIATYYQRCREECPEIEGSAGKWRFEDLIPGLSDFDTRFLTRSGLRAEDWNRISMAVGKIHFQLALERPEWARTLEHLPGVNLMWDELFAPENYYTEFCQWTFYHGLTQRVSQATDHFASRSWSAQDTDYHWKRIALYYDRYSRTIDPPINLGHYESKYPLHSRFMHYLAPPLHSAVCLHDRRTTPGKLDAFRRAGEIFPQRDVVVDVERAIAGHYEVPEWYEEPDLTQLDERLEDYLRHAINGLLEMDADFECPRDPTPAQLRAAVGQLPSAAPLAVLFENVKFARFMKGRLWFFAQEVEWFDSLPLIRVELGRIQKSFLVTPLEIFSEQILGEKRPWNAVVDALTGEHLTRDEATIFRKFYALADPEISESEYKKRALEIVDIFSPFLTGMEKITSLAVQSENAQPALSA